MSKEIVLHTPPLMFTFLGVLLIVFGTQILIKLSVGGITENIAWVMIGAVSACVVLQILMHFLPERK